MEPNMEDVFEGQVDGRGIDRCVGKPRRLLGSVLTQYLQPMVYICKAIAWAIEYALEAEIA